MSTRDAAMAMNPGDMALQDLVDRVRDARASGEKLRIRGGGTKDFYGGPLRGTPLDTTALAGISSYEPSELVVTARAGTRLAALEAALAEHGQCLPFEPPHFAADVAATGTSGASAGKANGAAHDALGGAAADATTVGGMVAAGLSGPARAAAGSVRDHVLGVTLLNGRAEVSSFGGQVIKNVAGYDVSRLIAGSLGVLGVILEVSLKVMPIAPASATLRFEFDEANALQRLNGWAGQPLPLNAAAWWDGNLIVRLRGAQAAVDAARTRLGGEPVESKDAAAFWAGLRDHRDEFFTKAHAAVRAGAALWRISVPPTAPALALSGELLLEWGGAQRWLCSALPAAAVRDAAQHVGGHATLFRANDKSAGAFALLGAPLDRIHRELKRAFDPDGVFNPERLYPDF